MKNNTIYTGQLTYKNVDFTFVFDGKILRLIPFEDKCVEIEENWLRTYIAAGIYMPNTPEMEESCLLGTCYESGQKIAFIMKKGSRMNNTRFSAVLSVSVIAYIIFRYDIDEIDKITFTNPEIDAIYPVNQSISISLGTDGKKINSNGVMSVTTKAFDSTTTKSQIFTVDNKNITSYFSISRWISFRNNESPISLNSLLVFEFEPTNDYEFILKLWAVAKNFLSYLCYRKNVYLPTAKLYTPCADGKHEELAILHVLGEDNTPDIDNINKGRYIGQTLIAGYEGKILEDIAANKIYLRHIPETYESGRRIDAARFIMITTAFEWEFKRAYPNGIQKSDQTVVAEKKANEKMGELIQNNQGKLKEIYKRLQKRISDDTFQSKINQVGKDYESIISLFGNQLYSRNNQKVNYKEIGKRLGDQRNHFAHGDLNENFIDLSLLDLIFLEYIVYALQLRYYGIDTIKIQNAINELFHCGVILQ